MTVHIRSIHPVNQPPFKKGVPFSISQVAAGFPSPAEEFMEDMDIESWLFKHPHATFLVRVQGQSMTGHGIFSDDTLVVDRAVKARNGSIVVAILHGDFLVKQLITTKTQTILRAGHSDYPDILINDPDHFEVWGVVRYSIHSV